MANAESPYEPSLQSPSQSQQCDTNRKKEPSPSNAPKKEDKVSWTRTSYFEHRQKKLAAQAPKAQTDILKGVKVYFTGVKSTSQRRLERLVWENGGEVLKVWYRKQVTHVIADCLAASKVEKELSLEVTKRGQAVVVKPKWLQNSLSEGKKLPTWKYQVVRHADVRDVATFFRREKAISKVRKKGKI